MDRRGRRFDNIFIERLWRTVKCEEACLTDYEEVCLKHYEDGRSAARSLGTCFGSCNREQLHESLGYRVPEEARFGRSARGASRFLSLRQVPARQDQAAAGLVPAEP